MTDTTSKDSERGNQMSVGASVHLRSQTIVQASYEANRISENKGGVVVGVVSGVVVGVVVGVVNGVVIFEEH